MTLKMLCSQMAKHPLSLDVMLLFAKPTAILQPICDLLDNWRYEEDQNEYQPVYEEFGSVLLLLLAFAYRYGLTPSDLGIRSRESFVAKLLSQGHLSRSLDELTEQESGHLNGWIHGLFDTEAGGLGDELMSSCPPQDFYLLIPTLFLNISLALSAGALSEETLKGGLECECHHHYSVFLSWEERELTLLDLVDTFLLPSLVPAIRFLSDYLCIDQPQEQKAVLRILQMLLTPSAISKEASAMLTSVLNLVAKPLEHSLRTYQRRDPTNVQIEPLLKVLKGSLPLSRRTVSAEHTEMESWSSTPGGGLTAAIKNTIQGFVHWSLRPDTMPTPYTHRQMLIGTKMLGAKSMLRIVVEEIQVHSSEGNAPVVFDVATALLCAPDPIHDGPAGVQGLDEAGNVPAAPERQATLREALKEEAENFRKIQKKDPGMAEAVVRLHRKVQEQMAPSQVQILPADLTAPLDDSTVDTAGNTAVPQGDAMQMDMTGLDLMGGVPEGDLNLGTGNGGSFDLGDDIFGGFDATRDPFGGWDNMEDSMDLT